MTVHTGIKIKKLRLQNKDTLKELADKIDYNYSNLSKIERGVYRASLDLIKKLAEVYNVNPSYFLEENFTNAERNLLLQEELSPFALKERYDFTIDGVEATEDEIKEAVKLIRFLREK